MATTTPTATSSEPCPSSSSNYLASTSSFASFDLHQHNSWDKSMGLCVSTVLTDCIRMTEATTFNEIMVELERTVQHLMSTLGVDKYVALQSICDLFRRFISRVPMDEIQDFEEIKRQLLKRAETFTQRCSSCRHSIAEKLRPFLQHDTTILVNSYSRMVAYAIIHAIKKRRRLKLIVTESLPDRSGCEFIQAIMAAIKSHSTAHPHSHCRLSKHQGEDNDSSSQTTHGPETTVATHSKLGEDLSGNISITLIRDSAAASILSTVDFVLFGAEGVVESGGIINKVGTYQLALAAKSLGKPVYVAVESYKFLRQYPLAQSDIPQPIHQHDTALLEGMPSGIQVYSRYSDYTPPEYITLLFTDLGILTPSAVSDELIKLYHEPLLML